jgi:hypothetical protein
VSGGSAKLSKMDGPSRSWWILTGAVILVSVVACLSKGIYWPLVLLPFSAYFIARGVAGTRGGRWW